LHKPRYKKTFINLLISFLLLFPIILLNGCLFSPLSKGSVEGYVHEKTIIDTRPLEGALVNITGSSNTALTDTDGYFRIDEVAVGARTLTIAKEGYITYKILNVVIKENEAALIDNGNPLVLQAVDDKYLFDGGIIYYDSGEYTNALTIFQQLINDFPDSQYTDDAQYYIGYINEKKLGYYIQALLEYQELINNYPNSSYADDAQLGIGNCYYVTYDYSHAIEAFQKLIDDYPGSSLLALAQYSIAQSYRKLADYEQAILEFNKVIDNYPGSIWWDDTSITESAQYWIDWIDDNHPPS